MTDILTNIANIHSDMAAHSAQDATILAVTKYADMDQTETIVKSPYIKACGENKVQNGHIKTAAFPDMRWEFIGHLQSNKIRKAIASFDRIQSVDSLKCAHKIAKIGQEIHPVDILIQINGGEEPNKFGFFWDEIEAVQSELFALKGLRISGIMVVAPFTNDLIKLGKIYKKSYQVFEKWQQHSTLVQTLSMGMSHDYKIALDHGATMVRIGRLILTGGLP